MYRAKLLDTDQNSIVSFVDGLHNSELKWEAKKMTFQTVTEAAKWARHMVDRIHKPSPPFIANVSTTSVPVIATITKPVSSLLEDEEKQLREWIRELESQLMTQPSRSIICYSCRHLGHIKRYCPGRRSYDRNRST